MSTREAVVCMWVVIFMLMLLTSLVSGMAYSVIKEAL
jgi:hypothetical protein